MQNRTSKRKGFTVPETLVYIALLGIIFTGVYGVLVSSMKYHKHVEKIADMQQQAMLALQKLSVDISEGNSSSTPFTQPSPTPTEDETNTDPPTAGLKVHIKRAAWIGFASPKNSETGSYVFTDGSSSAESPAGRVKWQKWIYYYVDVDPKDSSKDNLYRKEVIPAGYPSQNVGSPPCTTLDEIKAATGNRKMVAYWVAKPNVSDPSKGGFVISDVTLKKVDQSTGSVSTLCTYYEVLVTINRTTDTTRPSQIEARTQISPGTDYFGRIITTPE